MQNLQAIGNIIEAPAQQVARDVPTDGDRELLEKYLRRQGVQDLPEPLTSANPSLVRMPWAWVYVILQEGQSGVNALSAALSSEWTKNGHLVVELRHQLLAVSNIVVALRAVPPVPEFIFRPQQVDIRVPANSVLPTMPPPMALWQCLAPLMKVLQSKLNYLDLKEAEGQRATPTTVGMMSIETADPTLTAEQRRLHSFSLQQARQSVARGRGQHQDGSVQALLRNLQAAIGSGRYDNSYGTYGRYNNNYGNRGGQRGGHDGGSRGNGRGRGRGTS